MTGRLMRLHYVAIVLDEEDSGASLTNSVVKPYFEDDKESKREYSHAEIEQAVCSQAHAGIRQKNRLYRREKDKNMNDLIEKSSLFFKMKCMVHDLGLSHSRKDR